MKAMLAQIKSFCANEDGATAVEYGLLVALIAAVIVVIVSTLGENVSKGFNKVNEQIAPKVQ